MCSPEDAIRQSMENPIPMPRNVTPAAAGQRQHDALKTVVRAMLASGIWGASWTTGVGGATASLQDLEMLSGKRVRLVARTGCWVSVHRWSPGGGSPAADHDLIRMAAPRLPLPRHSSMTVTRRPLYLGRTKRIASA